MPARPHPTVKLNIEAGFLDKFPSRGLLKRLFPLQATTWC